MAIVITSSFITQLKSWDFIFIPKGLTVFEKFEKKCFVSAKPLLLQRLEIGGQPRPQKVGPEVPASLVTLCTTSS